MPGKKPETPPTTGAPKGKQSAKPKNGTKARQKLLREAFANGVVENIRQLDIKQIEEIRNRVAPEIGDERANKLYQEGLALAQASAT